jgi:hypothetical protein
VIKYDRVTLNWYEAPVDLFLKQPAGTVGRHLRRRAVIFTAAARAQAGVDTGALRASTGLKTHERASYGQKMVLGSSVRHSLVHHEGSRPHMITGKSVGGRRRVLRFTSKGAVVFTHRVMHPGTRPNRYLSDNLKIFIA